MINVLSNKISGYRYERKFVIDNNLTLQLDPIIRSHPALFRPVFYKRQVNNIYFDSVHFQNYSDNINGLNKRLKVRIRWYKETFGKAENPNLEFKLRVNDRIGKILFSLPTINIREGLGAGEIKNALLGAKLPGPIRNYVLSLSPVLMNSYQREYYRSFDARYTLTVDEDLKFYRLRNHGNTFMAPSSVRIKNVVELKYPCDYDDDSHKITSLFPFRMIKNSKYVQGLHSTWGFYE